MDRNKIASKLVTAVGDEKPTPMSPEEFQHLQNFNKGEGDPGPFVGTPTGLSEEALAAQKAKKQIQKSGRSLEYTHPDKGHKYLTDRGFEYQQGMNQNYNSGTLKHYKNPLTGQRGQLMDKGPGKSHVSFFTTTPTKRRTPEQKARDNFVLYD